MSTEREFEVVHVSLRKGKSENSGDEIGPEYDYRWFNYNLVFRALSDEFKEFCLMECREFKKTRIYTDRDLHEKYITNLTAINKNTGKSIFEFSDEEKDDKLVQIEIVNTLGIQSEDVYTTGYETVINPILTYNEKFDVFRFWGYFMDNSATQGITSTIYNLSKGINGTRVTDAHMFLTCLRTLDYFWD